MFFVVGFSSRTLAVLERVEATPGLDAEILTDTMQCIVPQHFRHSKGCVKLVARAAMPREKEALKLPALGKSSSAPNLHADAAELLEEEVHLEVRRAQWSKKGKRSGVSRFGAARRLKDTMQPRIRRIRPS